MTNMLALINLNININFTKTLEGEQTNLSKDLKEVKAVMIVYTMFLQRVFDPEDLQR